MQYFEKCRGRVWYDGLCRGEYGVGDAGSVVWWVVYSRV